MSYQALELSIDNGLAIVRLNRPQMLNALNVELLQELLEVSTALRKDDDVRAVLLTGNGRGFCAGADLVKVNMDNDPEKRKAQGKDTAEGMERYFNPIVSNFANMPKPVIAAVNGVAAGGGMGLALAADLVLAAESASFVQVFIPQLGIIPDLGSSWTLPRLVGRARTMGMVLTGEQIKAKQAEEWGLIWRCYEDDQLMEEAMAFALKLASGPTFGIASMKKALRLSEHNSLNEQLAVELELQEHCCASEDFVEGTTAFLNKRAPKFVGR